MANFRNEMSRFGYPLVDDDSTFDDDPEAPFGGDGMVDPVTNMRRKPWSDDGFLN